MDNASYETVSLFNMSVNGFSNYSANSEVRSTTKVAEGEHNQKNILRALKLKWLMKAYHEAIATQAIGPESEY